MQPRKSRRLMEEEPESNSIPLPKSDRNFFNQIRTEISSETSYKQLLQLLDLYNHDILPLGELISAVTDLLHVRHSVLSKLRSYLSNKGIKEEGVGYLIFSILYSYY